MKVRFHCFLCNLLLRSGDARRAAFAIRAFNLEVAQVRDVVSAQRIGQMRFQFWKDAVSAIYRDHERVPSSEPKKPLYTTRVPNHPVAKELQNAVQNYELKRDWLSALITSRDETPDECPFATMDDMERYCEAAFSSVLYLILEVVSISSGKPFPDRSAIAAAESIGVAVGLVNLLRGLPFHINKFRVFLPDDVMTENGTSRTAILRGERGENVNACVRHIGTVARGFLCHANMMKSDIDVASRVVLLPAYVCEHYLRRLEKAKWNVFDARLNIRSGWLPLLLAWKRYRKKYI